MTDIELAIVGGGPAGICAAIEAVGHGAKVTLIDENSRLGGQIYRAMPESFRIRNGQALGKDYADAQALMREFDAVRPRLDVWSETSVWGLFPDRELATLKQGATKRLKAKALVLATGAYERTIPFPGWTMPGVFTLGGLQRFVKTDRVVPGRRTVLAGTGPLLWVVALQLHAAGIEVTAVLDSADYASGWRHLPRLLAGFPFLRDGARYLYRLREAGIPLLQRHAIFAALGTEEVTAAVIGPVDSEGRPVGSKREIAVDTVGVGYGLISSVQLTRLAGCDHRYSDGSGSWMPCFDDWMATSVADIFVAGDGAGIAGVQAARLEGRLASIGACRALGRLTPEAAEARARPIRRDLHRIRTFRSGVDRLFRVPYGAYALIDDATVICRCEEVLAGDVRALIAEGATEVNEIKKLARPGMGYCQGRMCEATLCAMLAAATGQPLDKAGFLNVRPPVKPIPLGSVVA